MSDDFLRLACVDYARWRSDQLPAAQRMLRDLTPDHIWTAAAAGNLEAVAAMLDREPDLVNRKGGPYEWEPLLYACYSRVDAPTLETARLLLERGADPNAGYLWRGNVPPFTAMTGAFGEGEDLVNQPPHPDSIALATLLLDAGADPNDGQTLYNRHFRPDDTHLKLLFAYGLGTDKHGPWYERLGDRLFSPAKMLVEELWAAARRNYFDRVKLLVEHGADVNGRSFRDGRTPYEQALLLGHREVAEYLLALGAEKVEPGLEDRFASACINGRREEVLALLAEHPELRDDPHRRIELVHRAVEARRPEGLRLMADLGFEISGRTQHDSVGVSLAATPLHNATGSLEMVKLLIELGADPHVRDRTYEATPLEWAEHMHQWDVAEYLRGVM